MRKAIESGRPNDVNRNADCVVVRTGDPGRLRGLDGDPRRSVPRTARLLHSAKPVRDSAPRRKFFYLFTCEYCFSHYVTAFFLIVTRYKLLYADWRGYLIAFFALVWIANQYMSVFGRLRLDIHRERIEIKGVENEVKEKIEETSSQVDRAA